MPLVEEVVRPTVLKIHYTTLDSSTLPSRFYREAIVSESSSSEFTRGSKHAECTFSVAAWDEGPFSDVDGELKMTHAKVNKTFHGDLEGQSTLQYLMFYGPREQTRVLGLERVVGSLHGKSGSFVLEHIGGDDGYEARGTVRILPSSGTGELPGLQGSGVAIANRDGKLAMSLDYELD